MADCSADCFTAHVQVSCCPTFLIVVPEHVQNVLWFSVQFGLHLPHSEFFACIGLRTYDCT